MKGRKFIKKLLGVLLVGFLALGTTKVMAANGNLYVELSKTGENGWGYAILNPDEANGSHIWKLVSYTSDTGDTVDNRTLYCLKAGAGFLNEEGKQDIKIRESYDLSFDLVSQKDEIADLEKGLYNGIVNGGYYEEILWLLDNFYISGKSTEQDKQALLEAADIDGYPNVITDSDIEAIQQAVLWYFTNGKENQAAYDQYNNQVAWLNYTTDGTSYSQLAQYNKLTQEGEDRNAQAVGLYKYLIDGAKENADNYQSVDSTAPITINTNTLGISTNGSNYIVGPINITKNNDLPYTLNVVVKNEDNTDITTSTKFVDKNGGALGTNVKDLVGKDFYISVPTSSAEEITVELNGSYNTTTKTYWVSSDKDDVQPIVEIEKTNKPITKVLKVTPKGKFDLALKKYIAAVSSDETIEEDEYLKDADGNFTRAPKVTGIQDGKVIYDENDKNPVTVKQGDYVLYTFRIYNEGDMDGYASLIRDSIPEGLEYVSDNIEFNGIWDLSSDLKTITTDYLAKGKGLETDNEQSKANLIKKLQKDNQGNGTVSETDPLNPDYREVQALFRVVEENTSNRVLTNYAQIADDTDEDGNPVDDIDSTPDEWIEGEDDQDIERVKLQSFDLALRKFITSINGIEPTVSREPVVDVSKLNSTDSEGNVETTAIYNHTKDPLGVRVGDEIIYTIRVYNEGDLDAYASQIKDHLPSYLEYVDDEFNQGYGWTLSEDGRTVTTNYLAPNDQTGEESTIIKAFDGEKLFYKDVQIKCKVKSNVGAHQKITNIADITEYRDQDKEVVNPDRDSNSNNVELPSDEDLPNYKDEEIASGDQYIPGQEDDDDFEKVYVQIFDLALRKFITDVEGNAPEVSREPVVKYENGKITYEHTKEPLEVGVGNTVTYTIRVYNEGDVAGYAEQVWDDIPENLEYLPEHETNIQYRWQLSEDNKTVTTDYLSQAQGAERGEETLLQPFNPDEEISDTNPNYQEVQIAFKVKDPGSSETIITNQAQIAEDKDENGNPIDDIDSIPGTWNDGEDDQDVEHVKVQYFDLALKKYVSKTIVIENGKEKVTQTGHTGDEDPEPIVKVELHRKKIEDVTVKFGFTIKITNEGDIAGYAKEITDYVPEGLKFVAEDNEGWTDEGDNVISTRLLENTLLQPGESATVEVILTWINGKDNMGLKTNTAEISEDYNDKGVPDRDSTPDNKVPGEDDIDDAPVMLSVSTGQARIFYVLGSVILVTLGGGIFLIKKYIL